MFVTLRYSWTFAYIKPNLCVLIAKCACGRNASDQIAFIHFFHSKTNGGYIRAKNAK